MKCDSSVIIPKLGYTMYVVLYVVHVIKYVIIGINLTFVIDSCYYKIFQTVVTSNYARIIVKGGLIPLLKQCAPLVS